MFVSLRRYEGTHYGVFEGVQKWKPPKCLFLVTPYFGKKKKAKRTEKLQEESELPCAFACGPLSVSAASSIGQPWSFSLNHDELVSRDFNWPPVRAEDSFTP